MAADASWVADGEEENSFYYTKYVDLGSASRKDTGCNVHPNHIRYFATIAYIWYWWNCYLRPHGRAAAERIRSTAKTMVISRT